MKRLGTIGSAFVLLAVVLAPPSAAQPVRNGEDVIWARDVAGATMTLDGALDEAAWASAETIHIAWNGEKHAPGDGQKIDGNPLLAEPTDPTDATVRVLRDGNVLWFGVDVPDKSIGGSTSLWALDGIIMAMQDRSRGALINYADNNNFAPRPIENIFGWFHQADTLAGGLVVPGIMPRFFGDYGTPWGASMNFERGPEKEAVLQWAATVDGTSNDDSHGDDVGYQLEFWYDTSLMGYDFGAAGGDKLAFGIAVNDVDYGWPLNEGLYFHSRVWWQNQWANNFNEGVAYIYGMDGVTVSSGAVPEVKEPELHVANAWMHEDPVIDGALDEPMWGEVEPDIFLQYKASAEFMAQNTASVMKYYHRWFRPTIEGNVADVVDPSPAEVRMFVKGDKLYLGVDVADQAISGIKSEAGRDGIRFTMRQVDSLETDGTMFSRQFDISIDSTGAIVYQGDALNVRTMDETAIEAAVGLKGASTVADPSDVDEGYTLEIAIDLPKALGYEPGLGERKLWLSANFFDGDFLESATDSYATRTWSPGERSQEASIYAYLDPGSGVNVAGESVLPERITLEANYPNPFNPSTTLRYGLPEGGQVTLLVYDVLGRLVRSMDLGAVVAGTHQYTFQAAGLASGLYLYRIQLEAVTGGRSRVSDVGQMILLK